MASENETVEAVKKRMLKWADEDIHEVGRDVLRRQAQQFASDFESAWRLEKAELQLAIDAEKARHTDDYKDERIRAQDAEIRTLKGELGSKRNIDSYSCYEDAWVAFNSMCDRHLNCGTECPLHRGDDNTYGVFECFGRWLFAQVADGGES